MPKITKLRLHLSKLFLEYCGFFLRTLCSRVVYVAELQSVRWEGVERVCVKYTEGTSTVRWSHGRAWWCLLSC